jgi:hypothetical protein
VRGGLLLRIANDLVNSRAGGPADFSTVGVHNSKSGDVAAAAFDGLEAVAIRTWDMLPDKAAEIVA